MPLRTKNFPFQAVCGPKFMKFRDGLGDPSWFPKSLPDCLAYIMFPSEDIQNLVSKTSKTRANQEMRYLNVTSRIILSVYLFTIELRHVYFRNISLSRPNAYLFISNGCRFTKSALRSCNLSTFRVSSINYYLICSLPIHKICALCGIFTAICVLLTTENSDDF